MGLWYIYDENHHPVATDVMQAATWLTKERKIVKQEVVKGYFVSTVFLGLDHSWDGGPPLLWETMIFLNEGDGENKFEDYQERYRTYTGALEGHAKAVKEVESST